MCFLFFFFQIVTALLILGFRRVLFGCSNQRFGGCGSVLALGDDLAYRGYECIEGLYGDEAIALLKRFYETPNPNIIAALDDDPTGQAGNAIVAGGKSRRRSGVRRERLAAQAAAAAAQQQQLEQEQQQLEQQLEQDQQ